MKTAQAFLEKLQNDQTFAAQLSEQVAGAPDRVAAVCAAARTLGYDVAPEQLTSLLDTYIKKRREAVRRGSFTRFSYKEHLLALYFYEEGNFHPPVYCHQSGDHMPAGCHCTNDNLAICADGTVLACRRMENSALGNVFTDELPEMWAKATAQYRQYDRFADCARCKLSPWCRGCPAVSNAVNGDYYGRDPQCWHVIEE